MAISSLLNSGELFHGEHRSDLDRRERHRPDGRRWKIVFNPQRSCHDCHDDEESVRAANLISRSEPPPALGRALPELSSIVALLHRMRALELGGPDNRDR